MATSTRLRASSSGRLPRDLPPRNHDNYPGAAASAMRSMKACNCRWIRSEVESRYFAKVLQTTEAANMIRSLFVSLQELNKGARRPDRIKPQQVQEDRHPRRGFMGAGIAYVTAQAGINVVLIDRDQEAADKGKAHSDDLISKAIKRGRPRPTTRKSSCRAFTATTDYEESRRLRSSDRGRVRGFARSRRCSDRKSRSGDEVVGRSSPPTPRPFRSPRWRKPPSGRRTSSASTSSRRSTR
jgi:hypothetical protein